MKEKQIRPAKKSIIKTTAIYSLILLVLLVGIFSSRFKWAYKTDVDITQFIVQDVIVLIVWVVISLISLYVLLTKNYYTFAPSAITHHKLGQETSYSYKNVIYIDEDYTSKHKTILFYLNTGKSIFLVLDEEEIVLKEFKKNCTNLISREEFHAKFPKVRL